MITSLEHWATSLLVFFLFLHFFCLVRSVLRPPPVRSLFLRLLPLLEILSFLFSSPDRSSSLALSCSLFALASLASNTTGAKLSFDALRIRFPAEFCGDKGSKPPLFPPPPPSVDNPLALCGSISHRPGDVQYCETSCTRVSPSRCGIEIRSHPVFPVGNWKTGRGRCSFGSFRNRTFPAAVSRISADETRKEAAYAREDYVEIVSAIRLTIDNANFVEYENTRFFNISIFHLLRL